MRTFPRWEYTCCPLISNGMINYDHFSAMELRVATVTAAERVEGSEKLLKLQLLRCFQEHS